MTDNDIRRALASYADATPFLDPKDGLAERFARRARIRRATIAGAACLAAVVSGTGVAALTRDRGTTAVIASDDHPTASPTASPPAETPSTEPGGDPTPDPTATPASPTASPEPGRQPSTEPIVRTAGGSSGLRVKVTFAPGSVPTGTLATLKVEAEDDDGRVYLAGHGWGDGSPETGMVVDGVCRTAVHPNRPPVLGTPSPEPRKPSPSSLDESMQHAWRNPGRYPVSVTVVSNAYCDEESTEESHTITFPVDVTPGEVTSNGPLRPEVYVEPDPDEDGMGSVRGWAQDQDGWITSVTIDWGDGSDPQTITGGRCDDGGGKYYPQGVEQLDVVHEYAKSGTHTVTVVATSAGCDGRDRQQHRTTAELYA